eukprot:9831631-Alexandrium_andersonii.AAC.1
MCIRDRSLAPPQPRACWQRAGALCARTLCFAKKPEGHSAVWLRCPGGIGWLGRVVRALGLPGIGWVGREHR